MSAATTLSAAWASATATARPIGEATLAEAAALVEGCIACDDDDDDDAAAAVGSLRVEKLWFDTSCTLLLGLSREDTNEVDDDDVESFLALLLRVIHREIEDLPFTRQLLRLRGPRSSSSSSSSSSGGGGYDSAAADCSMTDDDGAGAISSSSEGEAAPEFNATVATASASTTSDATSSDATAAAAFTAVAAAFAAAPPPPPPPSLSLPPGSFTQWKDEVEPTNDRAYSVYCRESEGATFGVSSDHASYEKMIAYGAQHPGGGVTLSTRCRPGSQLEGCGRELDAHFRVTEELCPAGRGWTFGP